LNWLDGVVRDLKYGLRMVRNARLISIAVVLTLAVGVGINAGIFTVINGILLRPRVDSDPATFARLYAQYWSRGNPREFGGYFSPADYRAIQKRSQSLAELAAWRTDGVMVGEDATHTLIMEVSCNFFSVYGLDRPVLGRLFRGNECAPGSEEPVAVMAGELWRNRFGADPHLVGKTILLNRLPFTVVGITPVDFSGRLRGPGIWVPYTLQHRLTGNDDIFAADLKPSLWLEGRLFPGHNRDQLQAEVNVIVSQVPAQDPNLQRRVLVTNGAMIEDPIVRENGFWIILLILTGAMLLLLVSCASGAVLLLSRAVARQQEIAVRISLGAARRRIVQQLLSENMLLALAAGMLGVYLALEIPQAFRKLNTQMPHFAFNLDWHVFGYLAALTLVSSTMAGLVPALESLKQDVWISLKGHEPTLQAAHVRWSLRDLLVIVQVCFCVVLMVVSVMFSQAVLSIFSMEPGFETRHVLAVPVELPPARYAPSDAEEFYKTVQERIAAIGLVDQVATSSVAPLAGELAAQAASPNSAEFRLPVEQSAEGHTATVRAVSRNYFDALGIPFIRGEGFPNTETDGSQAIVSQAFAAAFWPRQDPIGETVVSADGKRLRVIGVVRDNRTRYTSEADGPTVYTLRSKAERGDLLLVRFHSDSDPIAVAVKRILHDLDPQMFVLSSTLRAQMDDNAERGWEIGKMLLGVAGVAGLLALLGIYGVVGYSVTRRTREFGIRTALGATPRDVMQLVFALGIRPVVAGIIAGTACAFIFSMAVVNILREAPLPLSSTSPAPYLAVAGSLIMAALLAMIGHARRAASVQPLIALREE
jgi:predicted permease